MKYGEEAGVCLAHNPPPHPCSFPTRPLARGRVEGAGGTSGYPPRPRPCSFPPRPLARGRGGPHTRLGCGEGAGGMFDTHPAPFFVGLLMAHCLLGEMVKRGARFANPGLCQRPLQNKGGTNKSKTLTANAR